MKINTTVTSQPDRATATQDNRPEKSGNSFAQTGGGSDPGNSVTLSEAARLISNSATVSITRPESDLARINALKQEISAGTYGTDPARIAEKFHQLNTILE